MLCEQGRMGGGEYGSNRQMDTAVACCGISFASQEGGGGERAVL